MFDDRSDLAFYSLDEEMERYIKDRVRQLECGAEPSVNKLLMLSVGGDLACSIATHNSLSCLRLIITCNGVI